LELFSERNSWRGQPGSVTDIIVNDEIDQIIKNYADSVSSIFDVPLLNFTSSLKEWDILIERGREHIDDSWSFKILATISASIKSKTETYEDHKNLHDASLSLCKRVRCARLKSGNVKYWKSLFDDSTDTIFTLLVFFTWSTPKTIIKLYLRSSNILKSLSTEDYSMLIAGLSKSINISQFNNPQQRYIENELKNKEDVDKLKYVLSLRVNNSPAYVYKNIAIFPDFSNKVTEQKFRYLLKSYLKEQQNLSLLAEIKGIYKDSEFNEDIHRFHRMGRAETKMPYETAKEIMTECREYPRIIASIAESVCRAKANEITKPIGEIAIEGHWFQDC
jgi:hypothetical protein